MECVPGDPNASDIKNSDNNRFDAASAQELGGRSMVHVSEQSAMKKGVSWSQSEKSKEMQTTLFRQQCTYTSAFVRIHIVLPKKKKKRLKRSKKWEGMQEND